MVEITIYQDALGRVVRLSAQGHSEDAPSGQDILCAGVSALFYTAAASLEEQCQLDNFFLVDEKLPSFDIRLPKVWPDNKVRERAEIITKTIAIGLRQIEAYARSMGKNDKVVVDEKSEG